MKRCSENMQQIYRRTPMAKSNFKKIALQFNMGVLKICCIFSGHPCLGTPLEGCFWTNGLWNINHYIYYQWYVDDIFVLFKSSDHLKCFQSYLNSCHVNMSFNLETEQNNKISFLMISMLFVNKVNL